MAGWAGVDQVEGLADGHQPAHRLGTGLDPLFETLSCDLRVVQFRRGAGTDLWR